MSTLSETTPVVSPSAGFNKTLWQREYQRERRKDPEYRAKCNEYQRVYQNNKRASDPEFRERRLASQRQYRSKLRAKPHLAALSSAPHSN